MKKQLLSPLFTFKDLIAIAEAFSEEEGTALLLSGGNLDSAQKTILFLFPYDKILLKASQASWEVLKKTIDISSGFPEWVGYLGYEMGSFADPDKIIPFYSSHIPDVCFYKCACVLSFDHVSKQATLFAKEEKMPPGFSEYTWLKQNSCKEESFPSLTLTKKSDTFSSYSKKIQQAKEWILEGEIYQVNLSQEFILEGKTNAFSYFKKISEMNPAPFSAYLNCGTFSIVSSSPERLLKKQKNILETRPIKGTAPRGKTPQEDKENYQYLKSSEKERAELLMITDLMRNDLGKLAKAGSIVTKDIWRVEAYTNVYHLLSIIEAELSSNVHPVDILKHVFPGGSVTGCPKLRAMEAISSLEKRSRGIYTGSIGYFAGNNFDFNIAIRTLEVHKESLKVQLGGAIVIDSDPLKEFEETLHKGDSLFKVLGVKKEGFL